MKGGGGGGGGGAFRENTSIYWYGGVCSTLDPRFLPTSTRHGRVQHIPVPRFNTCQYRRKRADGEHLNTRATERHLVNLYEKHEQHAPVDSKAKVS